MITFTIKIEEINGQVEITGESPKSIATTQEAIVGTALNAFLQQLVEATGGHATVKGGFTPFGRG